MRLVLLLLGALLLFPSGARAHGYHAGCAVGDSWMGVVPHFHPGGYGQAVACGRRGYAPPPAYRGQYYYGEPRRRHYEPVPPIIGPGYRY